MADETLNAMESDFRQKAFAELFGPDIYSYLFVYDIKLDICYVSDRFVTEFELESPVIQNFSQVYKYYIHPDDTDVLRDVLLRYVNDHKIDVDHKVRFYTPSGREIYLRTDGFSDYGSDGRYVSGIYSNVTDFVHKEYLRDNLLDGFDVVVFVSDLNTGITELEGDIDSIFPNLPARCEDDIIETFASYLVPQDRQRFRNVLSGTVREIGRKFSIEARIRNSDESYMWVAVRGKSYEDKNSGTRMLTGSILDLSQMNELKDTVEKSGASHEITGLPTRTKLMADTDRAIRDRRTLSLALILINLGNFHEINDRYGPQTGNRILMSMSDILRSKISSEATLYHISIYNFAVLWPAASNIRVNKFMEEVIGCAQEPIPTAKGDVFMNIVCSAAFYPEGRSADELISQAEITLHKLNEGKASRYAVFSPADRASLKEKIDFQMTISANIRDGFENFMLYYQPLTDAATGELRGAEALLRWRKPSGEPENPEKVVAALEAIDQMAPVGRWILEEAIRQCSEWINKGAPKDFYVHINATADDLITEDYVERVLEILDKYSLPPENILIELTETSLTKNMSVCRHNIELLHENGIRTALDDFGSGYSSFDYLKELPVDEIKIDKTFVDDMLTSKFDNTFISAMTMLAHSIGKGVVVEGVESGEQYEMLRDMGADIIQGYFFGKPMSVFAFWNKYFS